MTDGCGQCWNNQVVRKSVGKTVAADWMLPNAPLSKGIPANSPCINSIMPGTKQIIEDATALPVEERAIVVDSLLRTLNAPNPEIDRAWADVAKRRLADLRTGRVKPVPGEEVFAQIRERFTR